MKTTPWTNLRLHTNSCVHLSVHSSLSIVKRFNENPIHSRCCCCWCCWFSLVFICTHHSAFTLIYYPTYYIYIYVQLYGCCSTTKNINWHPNRLILKLCRESMQFWWCATWSRIEFLWVCFLCYCFCHSSAFPSLVSPCDYSSLLLCYEYYCLHSLYIGKCFWTADPTRLRCGTLKQ